MTLGENIKKARKAAKLNQTELGRLCGWGDEAQSRVSNYELNRREPTLDDLRAISRTLGCPLADLIEGVDDSSRPARLSRRISALDPGDQKRIEDIIEAFEKASRLTGQ